LEDFQWELKCRIKELVEAGTKVASGDEAGGGWIVYVGTVAASLHNTSVSLTKKKRISLMALRV
jgi:hypothetical protein